MLDEAAQPEIAGALAELGRARKAPYYDAGADAKARDAYYRDVDLGGRPEELAPALSALVRSTHATELPYKPQVHLYPAVDLQPDGEIRSIYTGELYRPEDLILDHARTNAERAARVEERVAADPLAAADRARHEAEVEALLPYNCEHVVPQSWFEKRMPMRGDLHHLFSCEKDCNSFRNNSQYFDFTDYMEVVRERCGKSESPGFEPHEGKPRVARATLYFLLRYPEEIDPAVAALGPDWLKTILAWHEAERVGDFERHRNAAIQGKQGNRNPFIDHPELAARLDWRPPAAPVGVGR